MRCCEEKMTTMWPTDADVPNVGSVCYCWIDEADADADGAVAEAWYTVCQVAAAVAANEGFQYNSLWTGFCHLFMFFPRSSETWSKCAPMNIRSFIHLCIQYINTRIQIVSHSFAGLGVCKEVFLYKEVIYTTHSYSYYGDALYKQLVAAEAWLTTEGESGFQTEHYNYS